MAESFFEKLKKGMGVEISETDLEKPEEKIEKQPKKKAKVQVSPVKKTAPKTVTVSSPAPSPVRPEPEKIKKPMEIKITEQKPAEIKPAAATAPQKPAAEPAKTTTWQDLGGQKGELALDVYQTETEVVIQSAIAGVKPENLDISIEDDQVVISGKREQPPETGRKNYSRQECFWGPFSALVILPEETDSSRALAEMKEGVLTIRIPKVERKKKRKITVKA
jgi:HSP20 family molecular chaperone IbpA